MVRIKNYKPVVSTEVKPTRAVRRMLKNPTFLSVNLGNAANYICLGFGSATMSMCGITLGVCFRLIGM